MLKKTRQISFETSGRDIIQMQNTKYRGVFSDTELKWNIHIENIM